MREVRCLSDDMLSSEACDERLKPAEREDCSPEPCTPQIGQSAFSIFVKFLKNFLQLLLNPINTFFRSNVIHDLMLSANRLMRWF